MGYTHFSKVVGVDGVYKGAKGSEVLVSGTEGVLTCTLATGDETKYLVVPNYACTWTGLASYIVSAGTGRAVTISLGTAGAEQGTTGAVGALGTNGATVAITNSANSTLAAGQLLKVVMGTCATSQTATMVTVTLTKA